MSAAIKRVLHALKQKKSSLCFPKARCDARRLLQKPKPSRPLRVRTQVDVVPARLFGSFEAFDRRGAIRLGSL